MARYSDNFERDWSFYVRVREHFTFSGSHPPAVQHDPDGPDAKRAFLLYDSQGVLKPTSEPDLLRAVLVCKASVNLHVQMWAESLVDGTLWLDDLADIIADYDPPRWVLEAMWRQAAKGHTNRTKATPDGLPTQMHLISGLCALSP